VGDENICTGSASSRITVDGGFATHVLVPHPRYLIDYTPLSPGYAGALMC
jgi:D-arabinose 1-dehydrogenase-like Zn-dependent alcohol dehydrogenase